VPDGAPVSVSASRELPVTCGIPQLRTIQVSRGSGRSSTTTTRTPARRLDAKATLDLPLPQELAKIHNEFERIHPFLDGNGRAGRLILNLVLIRLGYPPMIIFKRQAYLTALRRADAGDYGALGELIARAMYDNLNRFIVPNVAGPARLVDLAALTTEEFSLTALRQAAQRGGWTLCKAPMVCGVVPGGRSKSTGRPGTNAGGRTEFAFGG
jgi:hypothetical protein